MRKANDGLQMFDRPRWGAPIPPGMQRTNLAPDVTRPRGLEPD